MIDVHYHLQLHGIAHRDIKPQNIILSDNEDDNEEGKIDYKVCDVGSGVGMENTSSITRTRTIAGTEIYMSPEMFNGIMNSVDPSYNPFKSDVFSLGLVILEFCTLHKFNRKKRAAMNKKDYIDHLNTLRREAKNRYDRISGLGKLLKLMLCYDPVERPTFKELHIFIFE